MVPCYCYSSKFQLFDNGRESLAVKEEQARLFVVIIIFSFVSKYSNAIVTFSLWDNTAPFLYTISG